MGDTDHSMERERPRLSQKLRLRLTPLFSTTLSDIRLSTTPATTWPTAHTTTPVSTPEATTNHLTTTLYTGLSMARERPRLSLSQLWFTDRMVSTTPPTTPTPPASQP